MRLVVGGLACRRGERILFEGLDFTLEAGEALIVRGPNGAGKSSLLRILAGFARAEAGSVALDGAEEPGEMLHYLGHLDAAKPQLSVAETLAFWQALLGGRGAAGAALDRVGLSHAADLPAGYLSAGQRRRLALARLVACPRPLWLLDEPTASLDASGDALVGQLIAEHRAEGGILVAATHLPIAAEGASVLRLAA